jgi:hypothetical protein
LFIEQFGHQAKLEMHQDSKNNKWFVFFDKRFFESIPTKEIELILADYLTMLCSEWYVVFDCMAALHFEVLPQRLNKENLVNPLYTETKKRTLNWPDFDTMKMRQAMPKGKR